MKLIAIVLSFGLLCQCSSVYGQGMAFANNPNYTSFTDSSYTHHYRKHCVTTRIGEGIMLSGGAFFVASLGDAAFTKDNNDLGVPLLMFAGIFLGGIGGIVLACGKTHDRNRKARFNTFSKGKQIGVAYTLFSY